MRKDPYVQLDEALNELETLRTELAAERARTGKWRDTTLKCVQIGGELLTELADERARADDLDRRLQDVISALPNTAEYLDPPDGGDVAIGEQVRRMKAHRDRLRAAIERAPHADFCLGSSFRMADGTRADLCNCWKAAALKEGGDEHQGRVMEGK